MENLEVLYKKLLRRPQLSPNYATVNCAERADVICGELVRAGHTDVNIYSLNPARILDNVFKVVADVSFVAPRCNYGPCIHANETETIEWNFHTVAGLDIGDGRHIVFDTILFDGPVSLNKWTSELKIRPLGCKDAPGVPLVRHPGMLQVNKFQYSKYSLEKNMEYLDKEHNYECIRCTRGKAMGTAPHDCLRKIVLRESR